jgi:hypothetical protein
LGAGSEWGVAIGTALLAIATFVLAWRAKQEAEAVRRESELLAEQLAASQRPVVFPITPHDWLEEGGGRGLWLAFRNGGTGVAKNVRGEIWWHHAGEDGVRLLGATLGAGDHSRIRLDETGR